MLLSGAIVIALGEGWLVACLAVAAMAYLPEMGSRITSGRFDMVAGGIGIHGAASRAARFAD
jgi:hypothetical protein